VSGSARISVSACSLLARHLAGAAPSYKAGADEVIINTHETGGYRGCVRSIYIVQDNGSTIYSSNIGVRYCKQYIKVVPRVEINLADPKVNYGVFLEFDGTPTGTKVVAYREGSR
jgi:hypothetical protein